MKESPEIRTSFVGSMRNAPGRSFVLGLLVIILIVLCSGVFVAWHTFLKNKSNQIMSDAQLKEKLDTYYREEGVPAGDNGADLYNYGLGAATTTTSTSSLKGIFAFTGRDTKILPKASVYFLDLATKRLYVPTYFKYNTLFVFSGYNDVTNPQGSFVDAISRESIKNPDNAIGLHYYDYTTGRFTYLASAIGPTEARNLTFSTTSQKLAFSRFKKHIESVVDTTPIESWQTVIIDPKTDSRLAVLDNAYDPKWSPDGTKLLLLRSDGLYLYDLASSTQKKVRGLDGNGLVISSTMIDVSPNGKYLAWTVARKGLIVIYEITDWNNFSMKEIGRITEPNTHILWPQFSPDSQYYAVQAIDAPKEGTTTRENPRFEFRPTLGRDIVLQYPTGDFNFEEFNTDSWISNDPTASSTLNTATTTVQ